MSLEDETLCLPESLVFRLFLVCSMKVLRQKFDKFKVCFSQVFSLNLTETPSLKNHRGSTIKTITQSWDGVANNDEGGAKVLPLAEWTSTGRALLCL